MLLSVRADHPNIQQRHTRHCRRGLPRLPAFLDRVHTVSHHRLPQSQVAQRQGIRHPITAGAHVARQHTRITDRLLNHVDAQVHRADLACQCLGKGGFAGTRQPVEDN